MDTQSEVRWAQTLIPCVLASSDRLRTIVPKGVDMLKLSIALVIATFVSSATASVEKISLDGTSQEIPGQTGFEAVSGNGQFLFFEKGGVAYRKDLSTLQLINLGSALSLDGSNISYDGNRVGLADNYQQLTVIDIALGKKFVIQAPGYPANGKFVDMVKMSASGKFVLIRPGDKSEVVIKNLDADTSVSIPVKYLWSSEFSKMGDFLALVDDSKLEIYDLSSMTVHTQPANSQIALGNSWCIPTDSVTAICSGGPDIFSVSLTNGTMTSVAPSLGSLDGNYDFTVSPSGQYLYFYDGGNYTEVAMAYRTNLMNGEVETLFHAADANDNGTDSSPETLFVFSLSASSGNGEGFYFTSNATNLVPNDLASHSDVYQWSE
jgi:hypothetical protein